MRRFAVDALARFVFVLPTCWLAFHVSHAVFSCVTMKLRTEDCFEHVLVMPFISLFLPARSTPYLLIILAALLIAGFWAAISRTGALRKLKK